MKDDQFTQILRAINDVRGDVRDFKDEMNRRWKENDKCWEENNKKWTANEKALNVIRQRIERNYKGLFMVFEGYETSVENMYQENKQRIIAIEKRLNIANA